MTGLGILVSSCVLSDPVFCQATRRAGASCSINEDCSKRRGLLLCRRDNQGWSRAQEGGVELEAMYRRVF
jgi:hypothetical protein